MLSSILLILASAVLSMALRSYRNAVLQKLGALAVLLTSFLAGWLLSGYVIAGILCALSWLLLPWLEILTRVRRLRLPPENNLRRKTPPSRELFPALEEITAEIEEEGFEHVEDAGWEWEDCRQFFRLFYRSRDRARAAICLTDQHDVAFYYLSISSRGKDGAIWMTWNYPFSGSLKLAPELKINRTRGDQTFLQILASHQTFLQRHRVGCERLEEPDPDGLHSEIQKDMRAQIAHNLAAGVLTRAGEGAVRYSWRGLFFIWLQFLRDVVRL